MSEWLRRFFAPSLFEDEEKTRTVNILSSIGWVAFVVILFVALSRLMTGEYTSASTRSFFITILTALFTVQIFLRFGYVKVPGYFMIVFIWGLISTQSYLADGIHDPAILAYPIIILLAALLLGWQSGLVTGLLSIAVIWLLAYQEHTGLRANMLGLPYSYARDITAIFIVSSILTYILIYRLNRSLSDSQLELHERLRADEKLQRQAGYLSALHETTFGLLNRLELNPLLESILARTAELLETPHIGIDLLNSDGSLAQELGNGIFKDWNGTITEKGKGITGRVWEKGEIVFVEDYEAWEGKNPEASGLGFFSVAGVPLKIGDKVLGILVVATTETEQRMTFEQIPLLERFAALAALAIDNANLYEEAQKELRERKAVEEDLHMSKERLQQQSHYLTALHETTFGLLNRLELKPLLESILLRTGELLNTPHVGIDLVLPDGSGLRQELGIGEFTKWNQTTIKLGQGMVGNIWQTGKTLLVEDYEAYEEKIAVASRSGFITVVGTPLKSGQTVIGTLVVAYRERNQVVTPEQVDVLERLAALGALAIDNANLYEAAQRDLNERKVIEQDLRSSEERFRKVFNNNNIAISIVTLEEGIFLEANNAFWKLSGLSPATALGYSAVELNLWEHPEERDIYVNNLLEKGSLADVEVEFNNGSQKKTSIAYYELITIKNQLCILCMFSDTSEQRQTQRELEKSETRTRAIIASIPDMIFEVLGDGTFLDFMASAELNPIMEAHEFIGKKLQLMLPPKIAEQTMFALERALLTQKIHAFEYGLPPGEEIQFFEARVAPVTSRSAIIMVRDISQRRWVETEREKLINELENKNAESEALRESMAIIVETLDESKTVSLILEQLEKVILYDSASVQLLKNDMLEVVSVSKFENPDIHIGLRFIVDENEPSYSLFTGQASHILIKNTPLPSITPEANIIHKDIRSWLAVPLKVKGNFIGIIALDGYHEDQFSQKDINLALAYANQVAIALENARLFSEVQNELTERKRLIHELEGKNAELERFTYTVSHDLKSPIITIRGFLGFLERDALSGNLPRLQSDIKRISDATEKMQTLLNDLLELSRIGRLVNQSAMTSFNQIVSEALELVQGQMQAARIQVQVQEGMASVYVDHPRIVEAMQNLLDNAIKFTGGDPRIEVGQQGMEDGKPVFFVRDHGIGIDPAHHERIFGLFNKLDANSEGTGIGLAIVKRIIEVHTGRIWVESEPKKGSTFFFTLPSDPSLES